MKKYLRFHKTYLLFTVLLLLIEIVIALFVHDNFIRPYAGDVLVVILIYCFLKTFLNIPALPTAIAVFLFACSVEYLQFLHITERLGLQNNTAAHIIIGSSFEWLDIAAYAAGTLLLLIVETAIHRKKSTTS
jgi:hypothetical protein